MRLYLNEELDALFLILVESHPVLHYRTIKVIVSEQRVFGSVCRAHMPLSVWDLSVCYLLLLSSLTIFSSTILNKRQENASPCLTPVFALKLSILTWQSTLPIVVAVIFTRCSGKLKNHIALYSWELLIVSYLCTFKINK